MTGASDEASDVGLCRACEHSRVVRSDRGSAFWLCKLSETDPRFPRYPRLPVVECDGYLPESEEQDDGR